MIKKKTGQSIKCECVVKKKSGCGRWMKYLLVRGHDCRGKSRDMLSPRGNVNRTVLIELCWTIHVCVSCFSHVCDKALDRSSLGKEEFLLAQCEVQSITGERQGLRLCSACIHHQEQKGLNYSAHLAFSPFFVWISSPLILPPTVKSGSSHSSNPI